MVGVTAGASAPGILVERAVGFLKDKGASVVQEHDGIHERVVFIMPKELR